MGKKVLFISPKVGGFNIVIQKELERQKYEVDFIEEHFVSNDPYFVRNKKIYSDDYIDCFNESLKVFWTSKLSEPQHDKIYDILFVIDGRGLHHCIFDILKQRNKDLYSVNYLYDTIRSIYRFDRQFGNFDRVITYDRQDQQNYNLEFLPICWNKQSAKNVKEFKIFGMGAFFPERNKLFKYVLDISKACRYKSFIKLYYPPVKFYLLKYFANIFLRKKKYLSPKLYFSDYILHRFMSNDKFNDLLSKSEVILDSVDPRQDGLTARFTWALGAEKKIITDNRFVEDYDFFSKEQVFVVKDFSKATTEKLISFLDHPFSMTQDIRKKVQKFRIDNWVKFIMNEENQTKYRYSCI